MSVNAWGFGAAPLLKPATAESAETVAWLSDLHFPHQNQELVLSALRLIKKVKPHRVIIGGDVNDFFQLSRFNAGLERIDSLQQEIDEGNDFRAALRKAAPNALIEEVEGNHCSRIKTYVSHNARALTSLRALEPENLFHWKQNEITSHTGAGFRLRPHFLVKHGTIVRGEVGATAKAELAHAGISGMSGHTHRLGTYRKVGYKPLQWTEGGCLCRLDPDYVTGVPNWSNGILLGQFSTVSEAFLVEEVQALDGKLVWGGKSW